MTTTTEVLIVGAGPTGLMLANQLAKRGVRALIIDRHSGPAQQSRAIGVHARTLEIYAQLGVIEQALAMGVRTHGVNMWAGGERKARIPFGDIGAELSPYPFILMLGQDLNEGILGAKLSTFGVSIRWNTELMDFEQRADHVVAKMRGPDGRVETITSRWVAGCDGSRSFVREHSKISFPGAPYEHVFFVADTVGTGDMVPAELNVYLWKGGFHLFFPMRGENRWRVIGILPPELRDRPDLSFDHVVPDLREAAGENLQFTACHWFSTYRIHHRAADRFRERRCFLLGDAAHIHSPMGAQGMNTGIQDAYNLAWKLAAVVQGQADASLLDSYEAERRPVAQRLLDTTDRAFRVVVSDTWLAASFRTRVMTRLIALGMRRERVRRLVFRTVSQIGIAYPDSALSRNLPGAPGESVRAGDRFPWLRVKRSGSSVVDDLSARLDDRRFHLLVIGQPAPKLIAGFEDLVSVHAVAHEGNEEALASAGVSTPGFYLLRPDGHVALAGVRVQESDVASYLRSAGFKSVDVAQTSRKARASEAGIDRIVRRTQADSISHDSSSL